MFQRFNFFSLLSYIFFFCTLHWSDLIYGEHSWFEYVTVLIKTSTYDITEEQRLVIESERLKGKTLLSTALGEAQFGKFYLFIIKKSR